ncbi:MAG: NUDIX domain-containing protein [Chryseolinea sp.]
MKLVQSAGLLMCRQQAQLEFFLIHPGGPFWKKKNEGAWSIPKGNSENSEDLLTTAQREFCEETGIVPSPPFYPVGTSELKSGKTVTAWCFKGSWNPDDGIVSNYIDIEFPPRSKKFISIPEADRGEWMTIEKACIMINQAQIVFLERAVAIMID